MENLNIDTRLLSRKTAVLYTPSSSEWKDLFPILLLALKHLDKLASSRKLAINLIAINLSFEDWEIILWGLVLGKKAFFIKFIHKKLIFILMYTVYVI